MSSLASSGWFPWPHASSDAVDVGQYSIRDLVTPASCQQAQVPPHLAVLQDVYMIRGAAAPAQAAQVKQVVRYGSCMFSREAAAAPVEQVIFQAC